MLKERDTVAFRLVSRALPPKAIDLTIKTGPVIVYVYSRKATQVTDGRAVSESLHVRTTTKRQNVAKPRPKRSLSISIGFCMNPGSLALYGFPRYEYLPRVALTVLQRCTDHDRGLIHVKANIPSAAPPVIVVDQNKPTPKPPKIAFAKPSLEVRPSPHTLRSDISVPKVAVTAAPGQTPRQKSTRHIRRARANARAAPPRPPAVFWRPLKEWGVKAAGYSVGYEGSWPVYQNDPARYQYQRDTMRKGVFPTGPQ